MAGGLVPVAGFGGAIPGQPGPVTAAVALPDGGIVAVGYTQSIQNPITFALKSDVFAERLNANGTLDATFGTGGIATLPVVVGGLESAIPFAVAVQPDGKVVLAGQASAPNQATTVNGGPSGLTAARDVVAVARLDADGSPDASFGTAGVTTVDFATPSTLLSTSTSVRDEAQAVLIQPDGKVVAGGSEYVQGVNGAGSSSAPIIARLNANGTLDTTFATGGLGGQALAGDPSGYDRIGRLGAFSSLGLEPDGRIVAAGAGYSSAPDDVPPVVERLTASGSLDTSFGTGGGETASGPQVAIQPDGKVVVGGAESVARLDLDGSLDATFNAGAPVSLNFDGTPTVLPGGGIALVGVGGTFFLTQGASTTTQYEARLNPDGSFDGGIGVDGVAAGPTSYSNAFSPAASSTTATVLRPSDGSIVEFGAIAQGAPANPYFVTAEVPTQDPPQVAAIAANRDRRGLESITVGYNTSVAQAGAASVADYSVRTLNRKGKPGAAAKVARVAYNATTHVATITLRRPISDAYAVQVTAAGKSIVGANGLTLAGDGATAGSNYVGSIAKPAKATHTRPKT